MNIKLKKIYTLSNAISLSRILLAIPVYYYISRIDTLENSRIILIMLYLLAYLTDILDGYFARKNNEITELGKIIDPLADKILVILIISYMYFFNIIPSFYFWIIVLRDLLIFTGGIFVSKKIGKVLPSNYIGKGTVLAIGLYIIGVTGGLKPGNILYEILLYVSIVLSFVSVISYGKRGIYEIKKVENGNI